jgi:hypothetical protein
MFEKNRQTNLREHTKQLLAGPLKHVRAAGLAAALVPLAAVAANAQTPAEVPPSGCQSAGLCGFVWQDTNGDGIQDATEPAFTGAVVVLVATTGEQLFITSTNSSGAYGFPVYEAGTYTIQVQVPPDMEVSPPNAGIDDTTDSDGIADSWGQSGATVTFAGGKTIYTDFGFTVPAVKSPGTGTPGYWKNHPEAWPVATIDVGGYTYTRDQAIAWLDNVGKDKTTTMFSSLVSAKLNVMIGNESGCVGGTISAADNWMGTYGPVGRGVAAASFAWRLGEPLHRQMDNYNNGMLCAPHRD